MNEQTFADEAPGKPRAPFRRTALIVAGLGVLQLAYSAWLNHLHNGAYPFHFGLLVVAALLGFGGLRIASFVRWACLLTLPMLAVAPFLNLLLFPFGMTRAKFAVMPLAASLEVLGGLAAIGICAWLARDLGRPEVMQARAAAGRKLRKAKVPLIIGTAITLVGVPVLHMFLTGETAQHAVDIARGKFGGNYQYAVRQLEYGYSNTAGKQAQALVLIWNENEFGTTVVRWNPDAR
jgi:hypothetical protein